MRNLFAAAAICASLGGFAMITPAEAESCADYLTNQFVQARTNASNCDVSERLIGSINAPSPAPGACQGGPQVVQSQLGAFQACSAVYFCATEAYRCALRRVSAGESCQSAMRACVVDNPIPSVR
jgi:hypothetical protein